MRTYPRDIASTTCKDCKARGYVNIVENKPDCRTCMCQCQAGVFTMKDIDKLAVKHGEMTEMKARAKQVSSDTQMRESLETIIKSSIQDGIVSLQNSSLKVGNGNVMSAAAVVMSWQQFWSEEKMHATQRASTLTIKLKASCKDVHGILNASSACKGKRAYQNNLG
jgi:hypothetical protein